MANVIKNKKQLIRNSTAEFLMFTSQANEDSIEVRVQTETIWLSQKMMATLFDCSTDNISLHLKNIFKTNELDENSVTEEFSVTAADGKNYKTKHYNLDAIISVGYRVNSVRATQFRQWATKVLREFAIKGYVLDKTGKIKSHMLERSRLFNIEIWPLLMIADPDEWIKNKYLQTVKPNGYRDQVAK